MSSTIIIWPLPAALTHNRRLKHHQADLTKAWLVIMDDLLTPDGWILVDAQAIELVGAKLCYERDLNKQPRIPKELGGGSLEWWIQADEWVGVLEEEG